MKFAHLADVHLGYRQYGSEDRALDFAQAFKKAVEFSISQKVDFILIAGDLFHKKSEMDPITLAQATTVLEKTNVPVIVVEGNHDSTYFRERFTWMDYLTIQGHLINLKPSFHDGKPVLDEWDGRGGSYIDVGDARIYGLKYYGMLTEKILEDYLPLVEKGDFTIFMSHFGIEGYMNIYGCISSERLYGYRDSINYVALGHIHRKYVEDDFIFNPGSLESCDISEYSFEKGIFVVEYDGELSYRHDGTFHKPRVFRILEMEFRSYSQLRDELLKRKGGPGEVVHIKLKTSTNIDRDKVEKIARETLDPLVLRIEVDYSRGVFQALDVSLKDVKGLEKNVIAGILRGFGYEDIAEEVLRLKELFLAGKLDDVDDFVESIVGARIKDAERELKEEENAGDAEDEEEWRWWEGR
ncbi:metallophosphoesterase [Geoglobus acetivorans]|uniref:Exonuclease SbcCD subunit D n=1 Tax=Geoglobus acetivorans TaxID=565033 RepID=A0ABZ3H5B7_GEOAI|nr:exonuclease SbcCD subunit D [Geoglobus acetivorans]